MNLNQELLAVKLYELEKQYGKLLSRIRICGQEDREKLQGELEKAVDEYREHALTLAEGRGKQPLPRRLRAGQGTVGVQPQNGGAAP